MDLPRNPEPAATVLEFQSSPEGHPSPDRKPRRDDSIVAAIDTFDARGRACGTAGPYRVRLRRGVPGEVVRARVLRRRRDLIDAVRLENVAPSPLAVPAPCTHFGACGGCSLQDLAYAAQLAGKRRLIASVYAASGLAALAVEPVRPSPATFGYRNKMEFAFGSRRWIDPREPDGAPSGFALGLHAPNLFGKVIDVRSCPIQDPRADAVLAAARETALALGLAPWDVRAHTGLLRHLVIRVARTSGEILVSLVTSEDAAEAVEAFARTLLDAGLGITTLVHGVNSRHADTAVAERERVLFGPGFIREEVGGLVFALSASSFFQTNTRGAELLFELVREEAGLGLEDLLWDLYCGTGTLSLSLAKSAREVVGFEISAAAIGDARRNAELNRIGNARFVLGDVLDAVPGEQARSGRPDVLLLDPPRSGLHPRLFASLSALAPRRIVYVSCNPAAGARDVGRLVASGWRAERIRPIDLFPHTPHVECVIGLSRDPGST